MSAEQTFSTSDLRAHSKDYKREHDGKSKWAHGGVIKTGRNGHMAPIKPAVRLRKSNKTLGVNAAILSQRHEIKEERRSSSPDSSAVEDVDEPAAAPDAEITYSFDADKGPSHGSQILSLAVAKAVERYEHTVTDNIVQKEWEVLDDDGEPMPKPTGTGSKKHSKRAHGGSMDFEAEYEFV